LSKALGSVASGQITSDPVTTKNLQHEIAMIAILDRTFVQIFDRTSEISKDYFQDHFFLKYWHQSQGILKQIVEAPPGNSSSEEHEEEIESWRNQIRKFVQVGLALRTPLLNAAKRGLLSDEILSGIGERMDKIDQAGEYLHKAHNDPAPVETWSVVPAQSQCID
jgi:hypothetical protein